MVMKCCWLCFTKNCNMEALISKLRSSLLRHHDTFYRTPIKAGGSAFFGVLHERTQLPATSEANVSPMCLYYGYTSDVRLICSTQNRLEMHQLLNTIRGVGFIETEMHLSDRTIYGVHGRQVQTAERCLSSTS